MLTSVSDSFITSYLLLWLGSGVDKARVKCMLGEKELKIIPKISKKYSWLLDVVLHPNLTSLANKVHKVESLNPRPGGGGGLFLPLPPQSFRSIS